MPANHFSTKLVILTSKSSIPLEKCCVNVSPDAVENIAPGDGVFPSSNVPIAVGLVQGVSLEPVLKILASKD